MVTTAKVLKGNVTLYEGSIKNQGNEVFMDKLQNLVKSPTTRVIGGSYYNNKLWLSIDIIGNCESSIARKVLDVFGIEEVIINGVTYPYQVATL